MASSAIENSKNYNTLSEMCQTKNEPDEVHQVNLNGNFGSGARDV